jgi:hypothetical protein
MVQVSHTTESEVASGAYLEETGARLSEQYVAVYESRTKHRS